jgi:hypothetical protein
MILDAWDLSGLMGYNCSGGDRQEKQTACWKVISAVEIYQKSRALNGIKTKGVRWGGERQAAGQHRYTSQCRQVSLKKCDGAKSYRR